MDSLTPTASATALVDTPRAAGRFARFLRTASRLLLGLTFFVFGLNGFLNFIPPPSTPMPEVVATFVAALLKTGYMFPLIKGTEVLAGALLLANRFVPLALVLLAPVVVNIVAFHVFLERSGLGMALVILVLELHLAWTYRKTYYPMLARRAPIA